MRIVGLTYEDVQKGPAEKYDCPHCGKKYKNAASLKVHIDKEHHQVFDDSEK